MKVIIATPYIIEILNTLEKFKKHETFPIKKHVKKAYIYPNNYEINLYNSNTLTIEGRYEMEIYSFLITHTNEINYIGCDESGCGDFFGPSVYAAVLLDKKSIDFLKENYIAIKDSKKINNDDIKKYYKLIKNNINYNVEIVYQNNLSGDELNNSIVEKIVYHDKNILKFNKLNNTVVIDQFTTENAFYKYIKETKYKNLILETKADGKYLCVALASIIARAIYLEEMEKLEIKYKIKLPLGVNKNVVDIAQEFIKQYKKEELKKIVKFKFSTFDKL